MLISAAFKTPIDRIGKGPLGIPGSGEFGRGWIHTGGPAIMFFV